MANKKTTKIGKGDAVTWNTSQGRTEGTVVSKVTGVATVKGYKARATTQDPELKVKSSKSGKIAIHKETALKRKAVARSK